MLRSIQYLTLAATVALGVAANTLRAQQAMSHDSAMSHDAMGKDAMGKDAMSHGAMAHDAMGHGISGAFVKGEADVSGSFSISSDNGHQVLSLSDDFGVGKAPAPFVILSASNGLDEHSVWLGPLKNRKGAQRFDIQSGTDLSHFSHVVIWSKTSNVTLASADLPHGAMAPGM